MAIAKRFMSSPSRWLLLGLALILCACAALPSLDPPRVTVADIDDIAFQGLELRMLVRLRVQNPNALAIDYDGIEVRLDVQGKTVAHGVSAERGRIPGYGEGIVSLPVTISFVDLGRHALRMFDGGAPESLRYSLEGKLGSPLFGATRFRREGELRLPALR
jgi:LEA14-like dessication related protein